MINTTPDRFSKSVGVVYCGANSPLRVNFLMRTMLWEACSFFADRI